MSTEDDPVGCLSAIDSDSTAQLEGRQTGAIQCTTIFMYYSTTRPKNNYVTIYVLKHYIYYIFLCRNYQIYV